MSGRIFSIGHGGRSLETLVAQLRRLEVSFLIDVRSNPYSRFQPEFSREPLSAQLGERAVRYVFMGDLLGGRPDDRDCYDDERKVDYQRCRTKEFFVRGIERLRTALASVLTTQSWTDRILGRTEMITVPNKAIWVLTGNNPKLSKDIVRRSVRIRIDPKVDRAWLRASFNHHPLLGWVREHRGELVRAAFVLVQAWIAAGRPLSRARLGSFEEWAMVMGGGLEVADVEGFLGNLEDLYANADTEGEAWREFTLAWWEQHGDSPANVATLAELCERLDLMVQIRGDGSARSQQTRLGRALHDARDRVFGELQIVVGAEDRKKRTLYGLRRVGAESATSEAEGEGMDADARDGIELLLEEPQ